MMKPWLPASFGYFVPNSPEVRTRLLGAGVEPGSMIAAQPDQFVANERKKYGGF